MLDAIVAGQTDPARLAELAQGTARNKTAESRQTLIRSTLRKAVALRGCKDACSDTESMRVLCPNLRVAAAYSAEDIRRLMRTDIGLGGRKLGVMTNWARHELSHLNDHEIDARHACLRSLA